MGGIFSTQERPAWGFVCGRISVLEGRLKSRDFFLALLAQEDPASAPPSGTAPGGRPDDLVSALQDTFLGEVLEPGTAPADLGTLTDRCHYEHLLSLRGECPAPLPADLFLLQWDYLNLKNALLGRPHPAFFAGLVSRETMEEAARGEFGDLPSPMAEAAALAWDEADKDPSLVDVILDGAYLRHLLALSSGMRAPLTQECTEGRVLARALAALWRALQEKRPPGPYARLFLPLGHFTPLLAELLGNPNPGSWPALVGGTCGELLAASLELPEDERVPAFELASANHQIRRSREGRLQTASPDRVFSYLVAFATEMQNLKLVVSGRTSRVDGAMLASRLRECYG